MPNPPTFTNLEAWYRWGLGITASGGLVSKWEDASGNGNHLLQATGTNQPALQADGSILFDGVDNFMQTADFTLNQPVTVYFLGKSVTATLFDRIFEGSAINLCSCQQSSDTTVILNSGTQSAAASSMALNTYGVLSVVFNGASSVVQVNTNAPETVNPNTGAMGGLILGAGNDGASNWGHIQVKEVLLYSGAHDANTRSQFVDYLDAVFVPRPRRTRVRHGAHRSHRRR